MISAQCRSTMQTYIMFSKCTCCHLSYSLEEIAEAFTMLWKDSKNGAVLTKSKAKDSPMKLSHVTQEWK